MAREHKRVADRFHEYAKRTSDVLGTPWAFAGALLFIVVWGLTGPAFHYSNTWQLVVNTTTTIVTFLMVFLVQNTQNRDSTSLHLKLDELIRAMKGARDVVIDVEELSDDELKELKEQFRRLGHATHAGSDGEGEQEADENGHGSASGNARKRQSNRPGAAAS